MSTQFAKIFLKICWTLFFLYLALESCSGPSGHLEPRGSAYAAPILILICGFFVVSGKWKKAHVHFIWGCFSTVVFLSIYREYCYERTNAELYREELDHPFLSRIKNKTKKEPNQTPEPTAPSGRGSP